MPEPINQSEAVESRQPWSRVLLKIALIAVALLVSFWVTASAVDLTIYAAYKRYVDNFGQITGLDPYLANVVFLLFLVPFFFGVRSFLFSFRKKKRQTGLAVLIALGVLYNTGLYFSTKNEYFVGKDTKYYALVPGGVVFSPRPGAEPRYGTPFQPVTPQKIKWLLRIQQGRNQPVPDPAAHDWFDVVTQDPLLWYYTDGDGNFHFFDGPGYAPATGDELKPVTPDVRRLWEARRREHSEAVPPPPSAQTSPPLPERGGPIPERMPDRTAPAPSATRPPTIASFEAVPSSVEACKIAILRWTIAGALQASITPGIGAVNASSGYTVVRAVQTTQYTLEAKSADGSSASRDVALTVAATGTSSCGAN